MKLYLDTNTYLSYISPTSDIESLEKLKKLIQKEKVVLVLPSQTKKEFLRHFKERVIERKEKLQKTETHFSIPNELKSEKRKYTEEERVIMKQIDSLNSDLKKYRSKKKVELKKHIDMVERLVNELFKLAIFFEYTDEIVLRAVIRYAKDLPPKKNDHKFGDAINWETLKENIRRENIAIVSTDRDFIEEKQKNKKGGKVIIRKVLAQEWKKHTHQKATFYQTLGQFVNTIDKRNKVSLETIKKETMQADILVNTPGLASKITGSTIGEFNVSDWLNKIRAEDYSRFIVPTSINSNLVSGQTIAGAILSNSILSHQINPRSVNYLTAAQIKKSMNCSNCGKSFEYYDQDSLLSSVLLTLGTTGRGVYCSHCGTLNVA